jgi:hypothetical protein
MCLHTTHLLQLLVVKEPKLFQNHSRKKPDPNLLSMNSNVLEQRCYVIDSYGLL